MSSDHMQCTSGVAQAPITPSVPRSQRELYDIHHVWLYMMRMKQRGGNGVELLLVREEG